MALGMETGSKAYGIYKGIGLVAIKPSHPKYTFTHKGVLRSDRTNPVFAPHLVLLRKTQRWWVTPKKTKFNDITGKCANSISYEWYLDISSITPLE